MKWNHRVVKPKRRLPTLEQWCGIAMTGLLFGLTYGAGVRVHNLLATVVVVLYAALALAMLWNYRITYLRVGRHVLLDTERKKQRDLDK